MREGRIAGTKVRSFTNMLNSRASRAPAPTPQISLHGASNLQLRYAAFNGFAVLRTEIQLTSLSTAQRPVGRNPPLCNTPHTAARAQYTGTDRLTLLGGTLGLLGASQSDKNPASMPPQDETKEKRHDGIGQWGTSQVLRRF